MLRRRRKPTTEQDLRAGLDAIAGKVSPIAGELLNATDPIANVDYYDRGIELIAQHLGIRTPFSGIRNAGDYFWYELAIKLLQTHVPYFMPPTRRGPLPTLQAFFPILDMIIADIKGDSGPLMRQGEQTAKVFGLTASAPPSYRALGWTVQKAYTEAARLTGSTVQTVEREFREWKRTSQSMK